MRRIGQRQGCRRRYHGCLDQLHHLDRVVIWSIVASILAALMNDQFVTVVSLAFSFNVVHRFTRKRNRSIFFLQLNESKSTRTTTADPLLITSSHSSTQHQQPQSSSSSPSASASSRRGIGLYIHIPYCRQRCRYCDFAIVPVGNQVHVDDLSSSSSSPSTTLHDDGFQRMNQQYVSALLTELHQINRSTTRADPMANNNDNNNNLKDDDEVSKKIDISSLYFGGGTPSLAPIESIRQILWHCCGVDNPDAPFRLESDAEITMEMDPGTFDRTKLAALKGMGINRISLGVQSLRDDILKVMGRYHRREHVFRAIDDLVEVFGPEDLNFSIDLISGAPGLTLAKWAETLEEVTTKLSVRPSHVSIYDLQIEKGTLFSRWYGNDDHDQTRVSSQNNNDQPLLLPTEEECSFMYKYAAGYLRAKSYEHYEVSSYAAYRSNQIDSDGNASTKTSSLRSRHNQIYWDYESSWYAIGLGATSFVNNQIVARPKQMHDYIQWVSSNRNRHGLGDEDQGEKNEQTAKNEDNDDTDDDERLPDILLKRLRTIDGLDLNWLRQQYGEETTRQVLQGAELGLELGLAEHITHCHSLQGTDDSVHRSRDILRLKDPDGFLYSNYIISSIYAELGIQ
jgi:coproporphyrinogen III oxidase-like Fe-S oxidoreductase